jgi:hypothetical protein
LLTSINPRLEHLQGFLPHTETPHRCDRAAAQRHYAGRAESWTLYRQSGRRLCKPEQNLIEFHLNSRNSSNFVSDNIFYTELSFFEKKASYIYCKLEMK